MHFHDESDTCIALKKGCFLISVISDRRESRSFLSSWAKASKTNSNGEVKNTYLAHKISCVFRHQLALNNDKKFVAFDMFR